MPRDAELPGRLRGVLATIYLVFNEGYLPSSGAESIREDASAPKRSAWSRVVRSLMPD